MNKEHRQNYLKIITVIIINDENFGVLLLLLQSKIASSKHFSTIGHLLIELKSGARKFAVLPPFT